MASDEYTSSSESEEVENSATEISTDSEFEHDGTTPTQHNIPDIVISESVHVKRGETLTITIVIKYNINSQTISQFS